MTKFNEINNSILHAYQSQILIKYDFTTTITSTR